MKGGRNRKRGNVYALWNMSVLCSIRYSYEVWKYTWRHKRGHSHSPCSGLWEQDMMPKQRGASLATKFRGASPGVQVPEMGEAEATYLKQEPMQCARLVEVMRGEGDLVLMAGAVVVSRPQRAGPVAVAWTGRSMQAPNKSLRRGRGKQRERAPNPDRERHKNELVVRRVVGSWRDSAVGGGLTATRRRR